MYTTIDGIEGIQNFMQNTKLTPYGFEYRSMILWLLSEEEKKKYEQLDIHPAARKAIDLDIAHGNILIERAKVSPG